MIDGFRGVVAMHVPDVICAADSTDGKGSWKCNLPSLRDTRTYKHVHVDSRYGLSLLIMESKVLIRTPLRMAYVRYSYLGKCLDSGGLLGTDLTQTQVFLSHVHGNINPAIEIWCLIHSCLDGMPSRPCFQAPSCMRVPGRLCAF